MTEPYKVGDTVMLRSGGPVMTIIALDRLYDEDPELSAICSWFASDNVRKTEPFPLSCLVPKKA